jgi:OOP family OmpA-OmpF porin
MKKQFAGALAVFLVGASNLAAAADSNLYAVASVGRSSIDADPTSINTYSGSRAGPGGAQTAIYTNDTGYKLQLGYTLNKNWALEGGYTNLGQAKYTTFNPRYTANGSKRADLFNLDLVANVELSESFSLLARLGGYRWQTKSDLPSLVGMTSITDNGYDFKAGVGLQYDFNKRVGMRGEFERFNGIGNSLTSGDSKVNLFTVGAVLKF